jgi:hypothetical protein
MKAAERVNKSRKETNFKPGDYLFVIDRTIVPGNPRVLRTKLSPSPYICVRSLFTSSIVKRISDGFTSVYSNSDLKKYDKVSPLFNSLPAEVNKVLLNDFKNLLDSDLCTIAEFDPLNIPEKAVPLFSEDNIELINGELVSGNVANEPEQISLDIPFVENIEEPVPINDEMYDDDENDIDMPDKINANDDPSYADSDNDDEDSVPTDRVTLMRELEEDREEEESRQLERIEEESEEEEEEDDLPTGRANNRPLRFGRIYQQ